MAQSTHSACHMQFFLMARVPCRVLFCNRTTKAAATRYTILTINPFRLSFSIINSHCLMIFYLRISRMLVTERLLCGMCADVKKRHLTPMQTMYESKLFLGFYFILYLWMKSLLFSELRIWNKLSLNVIRAVTDISYKFQCRLQLQRVWACWLFSILANRIKAMVN